MQKTKKCSPMTGRCINNKSYNFWKIAKNYYKNDNFKLADKYGNIWKSKWDKYKLSNSKNINLNYPLEITRKGYEKLDYFQKKIICKENALDLVLLENANELFRRFMQEPMESNKNLEMLLSLICSIRNDAIYLDSDSFNVKKKKDNWVLSNNSNDRIHLNNYVAKCHKKIKQHSNKNYIVTAIALNLGEGGHYGAIIYNKIDNTLIVFDSMQINEESASTNKFNKIAQLIFPNVDIYNPDVLYYLQPTGGFEDNTDPILEFSISGKRKYKEINYQYVESQNHFCYIWACWFIHIILAEIDFNDVMDTMLKNKLEPLVSLKRYILALIPFIEHKVILESKNLSFSINIFPCIWSNHKSILEKKFNRYRFNYNNNVDNITDALHISLSKYQLNKEKNTPVGKYLC